MMNSELIPTISAPIVFILLLTVLFACWGSFLNMVAYRLVHPDHPRSSRSLCPSCHRTIEWYDLIPIVSWLALKGQCRHCTKAISWLYPAIELLTIVIGFAITLALPGIYKVAAFIFCSALLVSIRTDLETMLISRYATIFLVPVMLGLSMLGMTPVGPLGSLVGALFGFGIMWFFGVVFYALTKRKGLGEGDFDLMALIGSFLGIIGAWLALMIGSLIGSCIGIIAIMVHKKSRYTHIPFAPFLALGALIVLFFHDAIFRFLLT